MFRYIKFNLFIILLSAAAITYAQDTAALCEALVEQVLQSITENCTNLAYNIGCYAHPILEVTDNLEVNTAGQHFTLDEDYHIQITSVQLEDNNWGAVVFNLQPRAATTNNSVLAVVLGGAEVEPRISDDAIGLQFRTSLDEAPCGNTPSVLMLYVPENRTVEITVNGALLQVTGLITMQWTSENSLAATVHHGRMEIVGTGLAQAGQTASAVMDSGTVLFWSAPREINVTEAQVGAFAQAVANHLTGDVLEIEPIVTSTETSNADTDTTDCDETLTHTVVAGENLYRIGLRYGVTVDALIAANNIADRTQLSIGQQLSIPCGVDSGETSLSPTHNTTGTCGTSTVHTVQRGENLYQIALRYGTTVDAIAAANNITDPTRIHEGNQLTIPCGNAAAPSTSSNPSATAVPNLAEFCQHLLASAPAQGLSQANVNLYNQYCT